MKKFRPGQRVLFRNPWESLPWKPQHTLPGTILQDDAEDRRLLAGSGIPGEPVYLLAHEGHVLSIPESHICPMANWDAEEI